MTPNFSLVSTTTATAAANPNDDYSIDNDSLARDGFQPKALLWYGLAAQRGGEVSAGDTGRISKRKRRGSRITSREIEGGEDGDGRIGAV